MKKLIICIALIINGLSAFSQINDASTQPKENSPLSRLGLGNLTPQYFAVSAGFGGMTAAYRDKYSVNPFNPASIAAMRMTAYEIGLYAKNNDVKTGAGNQKSWSGGLNYMALGFPTYSVINEILDRKPREIRWGMAFSLMPYATTGYNINSISKSPNADSVVVANYFLGSGSTYRFLWGNGVVYKNFSAGANIGFLFGKTTAIRQLALSSILGNSYVDNFNDDYSMRGFAWNLGAQYDIAIGAKPKVGEKDKQKHVILGIFGNPTTPFTTTSNRVYNRIGLTTDTISTFTDKKGKGTLPAEIAMGVMYENGVNFKAGVEYKMVNWSGYKNDAKPDALRDAGQLSLGIEFIANKNKLTGIDEKVRYRFGYRTGKDPRVVNGTQVSTWAATAGLSFPMRVGRGSQISYLNLGLEYGKLQVKTLSETYFRINCGFTLNDNTWFLKRKFN